MPSLNIPLNLTEEQQDALADYTVEWNGPSGASTISDRLIEDAIMPFISAKVETAYQAAVRNLGEAARSLPYEQRKALIAEVKQQLAP